MSDTTPPEAVRQDEILTEAWNLLEFPDVEVGLSSNPILPAGALLAAFEGYMENASCPDSAFWVITTDPASIIASAIEYALEADPLEYR